MKPVQTYKEERKRSLSGRIFTFVPGLVLFLLMLSPLSISAQSADSLALMNVDSTEMRLADLKDKKALVVIFTGNHCVYAKKYEERLVEMASTAAEKGVGFVFVNSNSPEISQDDRWELMRERAKEKNYPCPYLHDPEGKLAKAMGATKMPEAFLCVWQEDTLHTVYTGKIDDNPLMATRVENHFLNDAIEKVLGGESGTIPRQAPTGCNIKFKE